MVVLPHELKSSSETASEFSPSPLLRSCFFVKTSRWCLRLCQPILGIECLEGFALAFFSVTTYGDAG